MRKIVLAISLALGMITLSDAASAKVNVNKHHQPNWGPAGYNYASFYFLPEYNVYYDVNTKKFHYKSGQRWVTATQLPRQYGKVDLYRTYKVVINDATPYKMNDKHIRMYGTYANQRNQATWRDSNKAQQPSYAQHKGNKPNDERLPRPGSTSTQGGVRR